MAGQPLFDIAVKGIPETSTLGDCELKLPARPPCTSASGGLLAPPVAAAPRPPALPFSAPAGPFCHRALLVLEEKHVAYSKTYVDFAAKPQWLLDVNPSGTVPVMKELSSGQWIVDSGVIADYLEKHFPEPKLGSMEGSGKAGGAIFGAFREFAKSSDEEAAAKEAALLAAYRELEDYLVANGGPYVGGAAPDATDVSLMPKLYHAQVALKHFRVSAPCIKLIASSF